MYNPAIVRSSVEKLLAVGASSAALMAGCSFNEKDQSRAKPLMPDNSYAGSMIRGLQAVYDNNDETRFNTSGLVIRKLSPDAATVALKNTLKLGFRNFSLDVPASRFSKGRIRAIVACGAAAINNPRFEVYPETRIIGEDSRLWIGFYELHRGEKFDRDADAAEAEGDESETNKIRKEANSAYKLAARTCTELLADEAGPIRIPVSSK